jgi:alpha-methylacyl-CoA racemase
VNLFQKRMNPLCGLKVVELAGLAPVPFCGLILSDFGAEVVRVDKTVGESIVQEGLSRGKKSIAINLKSKTGTEILWNLIEKSDVLLDPFRPGVLERLGFSPTSIHEKNPKIIIARLTGWGQQGIFFLTCWKI